ELPRRGLLALADLAAVDDEVVVVSHAVDLHRTEGVAGDSHDDAPSPHRDRRAGGGGSPGPSPVRCPGAASGLAAAVMQNGNSRGRADSAPAGCWGVLRLCCTPVAACGYATGVGGSATVTLAGGVHGFPAALTSFIGRDGPLREVAGLLEQHRLVTVTGPGG